MKSKILSSVAALAIALTLSQPASADTHRTVAGTFEFYAVGQGDTSGFCLNDPSDPVPPEGAALQSCTEVGADGDENHVGITVVDSAGQPVYFTVQQGDNFAGGCGTLQWGDLSEDGLLRINGWDSISVFPWAGPGINNALEPGGAVCTGSLDTNMITPGVTGNITFVFHDHA